MIVDTHAHIYSPDETRYPPIAKPNRPPGGKASIDDLRATARANGVERVCAIQTSSFYRFDNRYLADATRANRDWVAGVCTLDPDDPHSPGMLLHYAAEYGVKGMRSIPARDGRLDHAGVRALWKAASDRGLVINVLINRDKADECDRLLAEFPKLRVVLDHCLNLRKGASYDAVLAAVLRLARRKNLHAKLTYLATGSDEPFPCESMHASCLRIIEAFGAERCVWGSDFPNALWTPKVSYAEYLRIFTEALPLAVSARNEILGGTASRLWFGA
jgi:predicted TIM-barrel fold metal-dependent hydrolase